MLVVLGQRRFDVPHAINAALQIERMKPDVVLIDLPAHPFQEIIDNYLKGKLTDKKLVEQLSKVIGKKIDIDFNLYDKFKAKKVTHEQLELLTPDASFIYIVFAAKRAKIPAIAYDVPLMEIEKEVRELMHFSQDTKDKAVAEALDTLLGMRPNIFMRWAHEPYQILEILIGHHPEEGPFNHHMECRICKMGVAWERGAMAFGAAISGTLPLSKTLHALRHFDLVRERKMVDSLVRVNDQFKKKLGREPLLFATTHIWHESSIEAMASKRGLKNVEVV